MAASSVQIDHPTDIVRLLIHSTKRLVIEERSAADPRVSTPTPAVVVTDQMIHRFLAWQFPADFSPDGGISFQGKNVWIPSKSALKGRPTGTNLLSYAQARDMLAYVLGQDVDHHPV